MRYSTAGITRALAVSPAETPFVGDCPLCGIAQLEVSSWSRCICRACNYFGSGLDIYRKVNELSVETAIRDLSLQGALDVRGQDVDRLAQRVKIADERRALAIEWGERLQGAPSSGRAILQTYGIAFSDADVAALAPHVGIVTAPDLEEVVDVPRRLLGKWSWLVIPCTEDCEIHGYWLVGRGRHLYLPALDPLELRINPVGFGLLASPLRRATIFVEDPVSALSLHLRHYRDERCLGAFVCARTLPLSPVWGQVSASQIFWPAGSGDLLVGALRTHQASVLLGTFEGGRGPQAFDGAKSSAALVDSAIREAVQPTRAVVRFCLDSPEADAKTFLLNAKLTQSERDACLLGCSADEAETLSGLLGAVKERKIIDWGSRTIEETDAGWISGGKIVSQAVLRVERIVSDGAGDARVFGYVRYRHQRIPFSEALTVLRRNTGDWVHGLVLRTLGASPVIDPPHGRRLFDIAQLFHEPRTAEPGVSAGWSADRTLRLPLFAIDARGIHPGSYEVVGPPIPVPQLLTVQEYVALEDRGFCEILLATLGNLVRMAAGQAPYGLAVQNRGFVVERFGGALGLRIATSLAELGLDFGAQQPLPVPVRVDEHALAPLFRAVAQPHALVSLSGASFACLGLSGRWLRLTHSAPSDYRALRLALLGLPDCLAAKIAPDSVAFYRDIAAVLKSYAGSSKVRSRLHEVAADLDQGGVARAGQLAGRLLALIRNAVSSEAVKVHQTAEGPSIKWQAVEAAYSRSVVPLPGGPDALEILRDAGYIKDVAGNGAWVLVGSAWEPAAVLA